MIWNFPLFFRAFSFCSFHYVCDAIMFCASIQQAYTDAGGYGDCFQLNGANALFLFLL